jgi:hypothetical protein
LGVELGEVLEDDFKLLDFIDLAVIEIEFFKDWIDEFVVLEVMGFLDRFVGVGIDGHFSA